MRYIQLAVLSLHKRLFSTLLLLVQLILSFWMINHALVSLELIHYQEKQLFSTTTMNADHTLRLRVIDGDDTAWFAQRFGQLEAYIRSLRHVNGYGSFDTTDLIPVNFVNQAAYYERNAELYAGTRKENFINSSAVIYFDDDVYQYTKFSVRHGRNFQEEDFQKADNDMIPIIIGASYGDIFQLGDQFESHYDENHVITYEVVGVLEPNSRWLSGSDYISSPIEELDDYFIAPFFPLQREGKPIDVAVRLHHSFIQIDSVENFQEVSTAIKEKGKELGINPKLQTVSDDLQKFKDDRKQSSQITLFLGLFFLSVTMIGVISVTLSAIHARRYELGVRMVTGMSKADVSLLILIELFLLVFIASVLGIYFNYVMESKEVLLAKNPRLSLYTFSLFAKVFLISLGITLLSALIPLWKINQLQLRELVGGRD